MGRIELELYADRLARHAERLRDDVEGGRMRIEWSRLERRAREELGQRDSAVLEALGVLGADDEQAERRLIDRRLRQLRAVERLQALVEREIEEPTSASPRSGGERTMPAGRRHRRTRGRGRRAPASRSPSGGGSRGSGRACRTPHSSTVSTGFWPSYPDRLSASVRCSPSSSFSPNPVSSNTPLPADRIRASRSQAMKPALAGGIEVLEQLEQEPEPAAGAADGLVREAVQAVLIDGAVTAVRADPVAGHDQAL